MELDEVKVVFSSELENVESNADKLISTLEKLSSMIDNVSASMQKATSSAEGFNSFLQSIEQSASASKEVVSSFSSMTQGIEQIGGVSKSASGDLDKIAESASALDEAGKKAESSGNQAAKAAVKWSALFAAVAKGAKIIMGFVENSANAIKEQTKFNFVFGQSEEQLKEAQKWTQEFADNLYLDVMQVRGLASGMKIMATNFGINNELANKMSKNLTKLAYDLSTLSTTGDSAEQVMKKIEMGMAGQAKAMNTYGIMINQQALQNTLYANGINRTVSSLNSAERAYLTYYQIMKIASSQQGYFAKTVMSPANALNIIKTQFSLLAREIGNVFIPILMAAVPVIIMLTNALRTLARALAGFFGIDIDFDKYSSGVGSLSSGVSGIGKAADGASKKMKNMLRDFDELHVVDFGNDTGGAGGAGAGGGGIGFELPEVDYKGNLDYANQLMDKLAKIKDYIIAIGLALASMFVAKKVLDFLDKLGVLKSGTNTLLTALGIGLVIGSVFLLYKGIQKLLKGDISVNSIAETALGFLGLTGGAMLIAKGIGMTLSLPNAIALSLGVTATIIGIQIFKKGLEEHNIKEQLIGILASGLSAGLTIGIMTGNPYIGLATGLVIALTEIAFSEDIRNKIQEKVIEIKDTITEMFNNINIDTHFFKDIFNEIKDTIIWLKDNAIIPLKDTFIDAWRKSYLATEDFWKAAEPIFELFKQIFLAILPAAIEVFKTKFKAFILILETTISIFVTTLSGIIRTIVTFFSDNFAAIRRIGEGLMQFFTGIFTLNFKKVGEGLKNIFGGVKDYILSIFKAIANTMITILNAVVSAINVFIRAANRIRIPEWDVFGSLAGKGLNIPEFSSIPFFANGGFPDKGDLFIANEREPELIGSMGNRSVVANNAQITEGIAQASYNGMKRALQEVPISNKTDVYVGGKQLTDVITKQRRFNQVRFGN